jgi:hypothetical protein
MYINIVDIQWIERECKLFLFLFSKYLHCFVISITLNGYLSKSFIQSVITVLDKYVYFAFYKDLWKVTSKKELISKIEHFVCFQSLKTLFAFNQSLYRKVIKYIIWKYKCTLSKFQDNTVGGIYIKSSSLVRTNFSFFLPIDFHLKNMK